MAETTVTDDNAHTKDVLYSNSLNEVYIYLKENGFEQYWSNFDSNGYDNIEQLTKMSPDELDEVFDDVKMLKKGHRKRLKALLAIRSVPTNIVSEKETTSQNEKSVASTKSKCMYILYKIQIFLHIYKHFNIYYFYFNNYLLIYIKSGAILIAVLIQISFILQCQTI